MQKLYMILWLALMPLFTVAVDVDKYLNGESPYEGVQAWWWEEAIDLGKDLQELTTWEDGVVKQLLEAMWFNFDGDNLAVQFISNIINFFLVTIGLVALAILIYGFYKMFVSKNDEGLESAKKLVINTIIAIVVIGLAWFITTFLFDVFFTSTQGI